MKLAANLATDRYQFAIDQVGQLPAVGEKRVLFDIGAGDARLRQCATLNWEWKGFDRQGWGDVEGWDLIDPCPLSDVRADAVLLLDVIEHLPNPGLALRNIANAMKEGGSLILTTPNPRWSGSRLSMFARGTLGGFSERDLEENYHVFPVWPHVLERFLGEAGFTVKLYVTLDGYATMFDTKGKRRRPVRYLANAIQVVIEAMDHSACGMSYAVVANKSLESASKYFYPAGPVSC